MNRIKDYIFDPPSLRLSDITDTMPLWVIVALAIVALVALDLWRLRHHKPLDGPHIRTRRAKFAASHARSIRLARWVKPSRGHQDHTWPLPGATIVSEHLLITGGTGTGKTKRMLLYLIAHRLRQAERSLIVVDPKGEIFGATWDLLGKWSKQPLAYLVSCLPQHSDDHITPINPMLTDETARSFLRASIPGEEDAETSYWDNGAQAMAYKVRAAQILEYGGTDAAMMYDALQDPREMDRLTEKYPEILLGEWGGSQNYRGPHDSNRKTVVAHWGGMELHHIRRILDTGGLWDSGPTWVERTALYLCVSTTEAEAAPNLVRAVVQYLVSEASDGHERGGPKITAIFEEAGTFSPSKQLEIWINLYRGKGLNAAIIAQSRNQFIANIGPYKTESMMTSISGSIYGPTDGVRDAELAEAAAGRVTIPTPKPYESLTLALIVWILSFPLLILSALMDYGPRPKTSGGQNIRGPRELVAAPRYPASYVRRLQDDPAKMRDEPIRRTMRRVKLWLTRDQIMRDGVYLVVSAGKEPYLIDATSAYYPGYRDKLRDFKKRPSIRFGSRARAGAGDEIPRGRTPELKSGERDDAPTLRPSEAPGEPRAESDPVKWCVCGLEHPPHATVCDCGTVI